MPRDQLYIKKKKAIRDDYEKLFRMGKPKRQIVRDLAEKYFVVERTIYNYVDVTSFRKERKLNHRRHE